VRLSSLPSPRSAVSRGDVSGGHLNDCGLINVISGDWRLDW